MNQSQVTEALRGQDRAEARTNKFYRVDTAASTRPMLGEFQVGILGSVYIGSE